MQSETRTAGKTHIDSPLFRERNLSKIGSSGEAHACSIDLAFQFFRVNQKISEYVGLLFGILELSLKGIQKYVSILLRGQVNRISRCTRISFRHKPDFFSIYVIQSDFRKCMGDLEILS